MRRRYYLHTRKNIFYAELIDPETGNRLSARSTGMTVRDDAVMVVLEWLKSGFPSKAEKPRRSVSEAFSLSRVMDALKREHLTPDDAKQITDILKARGLVQSVVLPGTPGEQSLKDFLTLFWNFEKSPYVKEKLAHGQQIGKPHCVRSLDRARKHWIPFFKDVCLSNLTRDDIKRFSLHLASPEAGLSPNTRNRVLVLGTTALKWAFENQIISSDIVQGVRKFSGEPQKRGVLSPDEARTLFSMAWDDERLFLANLTGAVTGMRAGEIVALRTEDVGPAYLNVRHSYLEGMGLKTPKNGQARRVPIIPEVRDRLLSLAGLNPHGNGYVFWDEHRTNAPMDSRRFALVLRNQLIRMSEELKPNDSYEFNPNDYWDQRNIVFHSWRHFYSSRMADTMDVSKVMRATGHKTKAVFEEYADHVLEKDLIEIGIATAETFGNIVPFSKFA